MTISILGGIGKGLSLSVLKGDTTRPTSVLLRRRIFDACQDVSGHIFIDLCAGSGAVGFEAWSRGAEKLFLVEQNSKVVAVLKKNLELFKKRFSSEIAQREILLVSKDVCHWLDQFKMTYLSWAPTQQKSTIIFFDPPYENKELYRQVVLGKLLGDDWFVGTIWVESDKDKGYPKEYWQELGLNVTRSYAQGSSYVVILEGQKKPS